MVRRIGCAGAGRTDHARERKRGLRSRTGLARLRINSETMSLEPYVQRVKSSSVPEIVPRGAFMKRRKACNKEAKNGA